jgi:hypothetical protein
MVSEDKTFTVWVDPVRWQGHSMFLAAVHESGFGPGLPSPASAQDGSYQGISCRQLR